MRRFFLILLAMMLCLPALAEDAPADFSKGHAAPVLSVDAEILRTANRSLEAAYGLTPHHLGLFDAVLTRYGDVAAVRYLARSRPHPALAGEYLVLVTGDSAQAFWTHDDIDPALWQDGALDAPAWGAPQLTAYLTEDSFTREYFDAPYAPDPSQPPQSAAAIWASGYRGIETPRENLGDDASAPWIALGRAAVQAMYGLDSATADALHPIGLTLYLIPDGRTMWQVSFYHAGGLDEINYIVLLDGDTLELLHAVVHTGGIG